MKILHIDSSILGDGSVTRQLSAELTAKLQSSNPSAEVAYRDVAAQPLNHLSGPEFMIRVGAPAELTPEIEDDIAIATTVLEEFLAADVVVIGSPMYNFSVSSQLKAWMDRVAVAGRTFRYTATGPEGLAGGKRVVVAVSRGGFYGPGTPAESFDFQERYLTAFFGFLGIQNVEFIRAEGIGKGADARAAAIAGAQDAIRQAA